VRMRGKENSRDPKVFLVGAALRAEKRKGQRKGGDGGPWRFLVGRRKVKRLKGETPGKLFFTNGAVRLEKGGPTELEGMIDCFCNRL